VYDIENKSDFDIVQLTVNDTTIPSANAGLNQTVYTNITVIFDGSLSFDLIGIENYTWTFVYNNTNVTLYGVNPSFIFEYSGFYNITLNVIDYAGNPDSDIILVIINTPPTITEIIIEILMQLGPVLIIFSILGLIIKNIRKQMIK
jgi:hypothetical protein